MATLCLTVLSGKAGDVITKALTKCLKNQKKAEDKAWSLKETDTRGMLSPLSNLYPPLPSSYQYPSPVASGPYGFPGYGQYSGMPMWCFLILRKALMCLHFLDILRVISWVELMTAKYL